MVQFEVLRWGSPGEFLKCGVKRRFGIKTGIQGQREDGLGFTTTRRNEVFKFFDPERVYKIEKILFKLLIYYL